MGVAVTLVAIIGIQLFAGPSISFFGSAPRTIDNGVYHLRIYYNVDSLIYTIIYTLDSFAIGVGAANVAMISALLDVVIVRLSMSWLLVFALYMGFPGIYHGQAISPVLPAIMGLLYFVNKKWEHKTLIQIDHRGRSL